MSLAPKKYFVFAIALVVFAVGAIVLYVIIDSSKNKSNERVAQEQKFSLTVDEYKLGVQSLVSGVKVSDDKALKIIIEKLVAMRVPREVMTIHQELVIAFYAYHEALALNTASAKKPALERLETFEKNNSWLDISL